MVGQGSQADSPVVQADERPEAEKPVKRRLLRLEGASEVNAELTEIGLSPAAGWYASSLLYGSGGLVTVLAGLLFPEIVPTGVLALGIVAIVFSGLSLLGARYLVNADWATHVRLISGLAIFAAGVVAAGDLRTAFTMLPLFVLITPSFLYGWRFAVPYVATVTPLIFVAVIITPGPAPFAQAVITAGATLMITISFMVAENRTRSLARANRRKAHTDPLTEIANTRRLRAELAASLAANEPFALFAIDLDNLKAVNDTFDHTTGDRVIRAVANELVGALDENDLVARRGGDEFSVMIRYPDGVDLERTAERIARAIRSARLATCPDISPSGSVAWVLSREDDSISSVLQRADDELHERKLEFRASQQGVDENAVAAARIDRDVARKQTEAAVSVAFARSGPKTPREHMQQLLSGRPGTLGEGDLFWKYVFRTLMPIGIAFFLLAAIGVLEPLPMAVGLAVGLGLLGLTAWSINAARSGVRRRMILWTVLTAIALVTLDVAMAKEAGAALLDTYIVLALFGVYVLDRVKAAFVFVLCLALFVTFAFVSDCPDAGVRSAVTISVALVAMSIVLRVRRVTAGFVLANRELSEVDALTGVANLRALRLRVASAVAAAEENREDGVPVLMTVDLDRFKLVNDRYNHTTGDHMLEAVARAISECVRIDEMVARRGGDEFFVLFNASTPAHLETVVPRVREAVAHARRRICPDLPPTASVGFIAWQPGQTAEQFLASADGIMHDEKIDARARGYESGVSQD
jgi:diguanylate cyclase (GGDEF)-like protein